LFALLLFPSPVAMKHLGWALHSACFDYNAATITSLRPLLQITMQAICKTGASSRELSGQHPMLLIE
jgi:hypothetical protein